MPPYPHTPITIGAAAPAGALPRRLHPVFPETDLAPSGRTEALRPGALANIQKLCDFHDSGVNSRSCPFLQSRKKYCRKSSLTCLCDQAFLAGSGIQRAIFEQDNRSQTRSPVYESARPEPWRGACQDRPYTAMQTGETH